MMEWRALTLQQPYASAIDIGPKRFENRPQPIARRLAPLWVGLHAGLSWCDIDCDQSEWMHLWPESPVPDGGPQWPRGVMLGAMRIERVDRYPDPEAPQMFASEMDRILHADEWAFGPWCLMISDVRSLPDPIPCRGMQGLWPVALPIAIELERLVA